MTPDTCPKCGAHQIRKDALGAVRYECGSWRWVEHLNDPKMTQESERCVKLQRDQLAAELKQIRDVLKDPAAVWVNMLRGEIARPSALNHYEELKELVGKLEYENAALRESGKRLEEAGDVVAKNLFLWAHGVALPKDLDASDVALNAWHRTKEAQP